MRLERLALWEEKSLFVEQGEYEMGFVGWLKGYFHEGTLCLSELSADADPMLRYEVETLSHALQGEAAGYMLRSPNDLATFCRDRLHDHIPYSFNRECWGFRVFGEEYAWYIALTPWNPARVVSLYLYKRSELMTALARDKGLPLYCYGVLPYTGERILIRYGEDGYESFPQYGGNMVENRRFATEQNESLGITVEQVAAMEAGVIYGWDTPVADPYHYDENGHFFLPETDMRGGKHR